MSIDVIGRLYEIPADPEAEAVEIPGWHVNVTHRVLAAYPQLAAFLVEPSPLRRVWAGDDPLHPKVTVPLRFADKAEWLALSISDSDAAIEGDASALS